MAIRGQAAHGTERASVSRVLLLSDGQANHSLTDPAEIAARCARMAEAEVTASTYGLGHDFNEELMVQMARGGNGNSYYGQTAEDLMDPFREEFELLQNLCAKKPGLQLLLGEGVSAKVLNDYPQDTAGTWRLPDLAYGGEAWAAVRLRVPMQSAKQTPATDLFHLLEASLVYESLDGQSHRLKACSLSLPWLPPQAYQALASDATVVERFGELHAADLQEKARRAARRGDWDRVDALLEEANKNAAANPWLQRILESLKGYAARRETESLSKEAMYASRRMRSRLADGAQSVGDYDLDRESQKPMFLRRKNEQGKRF